MIESSAYEANRTRNGHDRSLGSIIAEIKEEVKEFVNTRVEMVKAEIQEAMGAAKVAAKVAVPLGLMALALFWVGFLLFTMAAVVLVAFAFAGHALAWFYAAIIVGFVWMALGAMCAFFAYNAIRSRSKFPQRTVQVLKADKAWLQTEARSAS
jgi:uncharacterized membrane protein YqjE